MNKNGIHIEMNRVFATGGGHDKGSGEDARKASPIEYVSARFPPTLRLYGTADEEIDFFYRRNVVQRDQLVKELQQAGR